MGQTVPFRREKPVNPMPLSYVGLTSVFAGAGGKAGRTGIGSAALEEAIRRESPQVLTAIPGEESGALHVTVNTSRGGQPHAFSFAALPTGKSVYFERRGGSAAADLGGLISLLEEPNWVYGAPRRSIRQDGSTWLNADDQLGYAVSGGAGIRIVPDVRSVMVALNAPVIVTLPGASTAATETFALEPFRLQCSPRDVMAVLVDGFVVASNLGPHPAVASITVKGRSIRLPVNGYSTRVLRAEF
jgi:hypothetical protein